MSTANEVFVNKENNNNERKPSWKINEPESADLKLTLNDSPQFQKKTS